MNSKHSLVVVINSIKDIELITEKTVYININIDLYDPNIIEYFEKNGANYYYSDCINKNCGYNYVDYQTFKEGNEVIKNIIASIPKKVSPLAITRYLYIQTGKLINYDINSLDNKNDESSLNHYLQTSNIWGSLKTKKGTTISYVKIFYYLCKICKIDNEIVCLNTNNHLGNKITIDDGNQKISLLTDLTKDTPYIQANLMTKYFSNFNENRNLDRQINYIKNDYNDEELNNAIRKFNQQKGTFLEFLKVTQKYLPLTKMGQIEIGIIYDMILKEHKPMDNIYINNLYINKNSQNKVHFILFTDKENYFSYNYRQRSFVKIPALELKKRLENGEIGIYQGETVPLVEDEIANRK